MDTEGDGAGGEGEGRVGLVSPHFSRRGAATANLYYRL
jgi:hypothetical protein